jgi:hypothetical protein
MSTLHFIGLGNYDTPVTLDALRYIAERCRELCEVSLCVDARLDALGNSAGRSAVWFYRQR